VHAWQHCKARCLPLQQPSGGSPFGSVWRAARHSLLVAVVECTLLAHQSGVSGQIKEALRSQAAHDVAPTELSVAARYIQDDLSHEGYRHLLAVSASLTLLIVRPKRDNSVPSS